MSDTRRTLCWAAGLVLTLGGPAMSGQAVAFTPIGSLNDTDTQYAEEPIYAQLVQAADGNFYGLTTATDQFLRISPNGGLTVVSDPTVDATEGPSALIQASDGNFYGMAEGGSSESGLIFMLTPSGTATVLHTFTGGAGGSNLDLLGNALTLGSDGNLYGVVGYGGTTNSQCLSGCGVVFRISLSGTFQVVHSFSGGSDGGNPAGTILQASDGNFYGITGSGGAECQSNNPPGCGTIFRMTPAGVVTILYSFPDYGADSGLAEGSDGSLYGFFNENHAGSSSIYRIDLSGNYSTLASGLTPDDGNFSSPLFPGSDGTLYSTTGAEAYRLSTDGEVLTYDPPEQSTNLSDFGIGITQGSDGSFYGIGDEGFEMPALAYKLSLSPALPAPMQLMLSTNQMQPGKPVTASLKVLNAFSLTMQQCYAFQNGTPLGKVPGTYNSSTKLYTFSGSVTPATAGIYNYAVTCGGVESGFATLTVGDTTKTTLAAAPNPVTPPANVTLTATVTRTTGSGVPGGSVTFSSGTTVLGKASLNGSGVATLSASSKGVPAGTYPVVATYSGDSSDVESVSAAVNVTVE